MIINPNRKSLIISLVGIVFGFSAAIAAIYVWLLPTFFDGYRTYSVLVAGVFGAALLGGGCIHKANGVNSGKTARQFLPYLCGVIVAALVGLLSLQIIVNVRGS